MFVLIIEDEAKTAAYLKKGFSEYGAKADVVSDGEEGLRLALSGKYDFVILDVMLPGRDGWSVISELREHNIDLPVIMLTALDAFPNRVKGLNLGVDDYMIKPFSFSELYARVKTILRRGPVQRKEALRVADLELDLENFSATRGGKRIDLSPKEFAILALLARHHGEVVPRIRIIERVWNRDFEDSPKILDVQMMRLRAKIDEGFASKLIHTMRGVGYILERREK